MAAEFHFFPLLPWELREMIWELAARPALPGAHLFRVYNADDSEHADPKNETSRHAYRGVSKPRLAAPRCLPRGVDFSPAAQADAPISWTLNNPSTYLIDSGLWTACKESLLVIEKELPSSSPTTKSIEPFRGRKLPEETPPLHSAGDGHVYSLR
jgi:hypothetical protein